MTDMGDSVVSPAVLTEEMLTEGLGVLAERDPDLAHLYAAYGRPPMWARAAGYATLVHIILEQQVSLASARAAMDRLLAAAAPLTPARFLAFDDAELKAIGFSRQKAGYVRAFSRAILDGTFDLDGLALLNDVAARDALMALKGVGWWTADIYLLMALRRPDVWPRGDLALVVAAQRAKRLPTRPTPDEFAALGTLWQPYRAVAARLLWHYYVSEPAKMRPPARTAKEVVPTGNTGQ